VEAKTDEEEREEEGQQDPEVVLLVDEVPVGEKRGGDGDSKAARYFSGLKFKAFFSTFLILTLTIIHRF
jgi:hypothetical protein